MNVALLVGRFGPGTGTGGVAWRLAQGLRDRGHTVEVWTGRVDAALPGVPTHPLGSRWTAADRVPRGFVRLALDRTPGCEVARASGGVHALWAAIRGWPRLADVREARLDRETARTARLVACNSLKTAADVIAWHGVAHDRVRLVPTSPSLAEGADRGELRRRWGAQRRVALFLGHGYRRKNLPTAWRAFAVAARPGDKLVVAGDDAHAERWLAPARAALGEALIVESAAQGARLLPGADALLHPTLYDAASNVVLEALAAGVPPVVSLRDGAAEWVADRALVVGDPEDAAGFAAALRRAWDTTTPAGRPPPDEMAARLEALLEEADDGRTRVR